MPYIAYAFSSTIDRPYTSDVPFFNGFLMVYRHVRLLFGYSQASKKALCLRDANDVYMKITCCVICFDKYVIPCVCAVTIRIQFTFSRFIHIAPCSSALTHFLYGLSFLLLFSLSFLLSKYHEFEQNPTMNAQKRKMDMDLYAKYVTYVFKNRIPSKRRDAQYALIVIMLFMNFFFFLHEKK